MKHTPGPWKVHKHSHIRNELWLSVLNGAWDITHNSAKNPGVIADCKYSAMSSQENLANAKLIAASPDLYLACRAALLTLEDDDHYQECREVVETLRNAIKKAE